MTNRSKSIKKNKKKRGGMTDEERKIMEREIKENERYRKRNDVLREGAEMTKKERNYYLENMEKKMQTDGRGSLTDDEFKKYIMEKSKAPDFHIQPGGKKRKNIKRKKNTKSKSYRKKRGGKYRKKLSKKKSKKSKK